MSSLISALGIDRLSAQDRLQLVQEIWDSLDSETNHEPLTESQKHDLDQRLAALDSGGAPLSLWHDVEARVLAKLRS